LRELDAQVGAAASLARSARSSLLTPLRHGAQRALRLSRSWTFQDALSARIMGAALLIAGNKPEHVRGVAGT